MIGVPLPSEPVILKVSVERIFREIQITQFEDSGTLSQRKEVVYTYKCTLLILYNTILGQQLDKI